MERDTLRIQRGEPYRRVLLVEQSDDGGATWTRVALNGYHFAHDIRLSDAETSDRVVKIRDDDTNAWAELEQLDVEDDPTGVIVEFVPKDDVLESLSAGNCVHDWALVQPNGDPQYQARGPVIVDGRITVLEDGS